MSSDDPTDPVDWAIRFTASFEAELLLEFMLRRWNHPFVDDNEYLNSVLESAISALQEARTGVELLEGIAPEEMTFVAAVWYVEWCGQTANRAEDGPEVSRQRAEWLKTVRRSIPSCFCNSSDLF